MLKADKSSENIKKKIVKQFFLYDRAKTRPPNIGFWSFALTYFQFMLANFQKNQLDANETGKCLKQTKAVKISKKKFVKQFFLYDRAKTRPPPQPRFLKPCFNLLSNYTCKFSKNQLDASETGKCWRQTKVMKISKRFIFNHFFYMMEQTKRPPNLGFWTLVVIYIQIILAFFQKKNNWMQMKLESVESRQK